MALPRGAPGGPAEPSTGAHLESAALGARRFQAWWQARLAAQGQHRRSPSATRTSCPRGRASCWRLTLLVLLVASINYQLILGYPADLHAGRRRAIIGVHVCHGTLQRP